MTVARIGSYDQRSWVTLMAPAVELAKAIAGTDFVPRALRDNPAAIAAAILYGDEIGLGPLQSLSKIAVIDGRPFIAAEAQRGLVYAAGHELWLDESTNARATWAGRRYESEQVTRITWTMDDARRAHLDGKANWRSYPRAMLSARASAELVRAAFADVIGGLRAIEELDDVAPELVGLGTSLRELGPASGTRKRSRRPPAPEKAPAGDLPIPRAPLSTPDDWRRRAGPEREPALMTEPQRRKMHKAFRAQNIYDRAERLRLSAEWVGRPLESSKELTTGEADRVISVLEGLHREEEPPPDIEPEPEPAEPVDVPLPLDPEPEP